MHKGEQKKEKRNHACKKEMHDNQHKKKNIYNGKKLN